MFMIVIIQRIITSTKVDSGFAVMAENTSRQFLQQKFSLKH